MKRICLLFQIHHPVSFQSYRYLDVGKSKSYYDNHGNELEITEAVRNLYIPTNKFLIKLLAGYRDTLKLTFHITGTTINQLQIYTPEAIESFRDLVNTGQVEMAGETFSHSIASLSNKNEEFSNQIIAGRQLVESSFGQEPGLFINTDLIYARGISEMVTNAGYDLLLTNESEKILNRQTPNRMYNASSAKNLKILFRNNNLSNQFEFLLNAKNLSPERQAESYISILNNVPDDDPFISIYISYSHLHSAGPDSNLNIFTEFIEQISKSSSFSFCLPTELTRQFGPVADIEAETPVCWCEHFHPLYFPGNELQKEAIRQLFKLAELVEVCQDPGILTDWHYLQASDHFHLMDENHPSYQAAADTGTQKYRSKYDAFINFMNILEDFQLRVQNNLKMRKRRQLPMHPHARDGSHNS